MPKWIAIGLGTLTAALAVAVVYQASTIRDLKYEFGERMARIERRQKSREEAAAPIRMEMKEIQEDIARVERRALTRPAASPTERPPDGARPAGVTQEELQQLIDVIKTVRPETWQDGGGPGTLQAFGDKLVISQTIEMHEIIGGTFSAMHQKRR